MNSKRSTAPDIRRMPTGIQGLDEMLRGGLPRDGTTMLMGGPGAGKTVLALQTLVNGACLYNEPGIFVAFEENTRQIIRNASTFGWNLSELEKRRLFFLDARMRPDLLRSGEFDLSGMLGVIAAKAKEMKARRIVFDSIDMLLLVLNDPAMERREIFRLYDWLLKSGLGGIITAKFDAGAPVGGPHFTNMQFIADCVLHLKHRILDHVSLRDIGVIKYRGSGFTENETPITISRRGMEVVVIGNIDPKEPASAERVSTGVLRLDTMFNGGYYRGSSVLITGAPGTAKSTLAAAFANASCKRGEKTLFLSFDERASEMTRNFQSVGIDLRPHLKNGRLRMNSFLAGGISAKEHFSKIRELLDEFQPQSLVIDPLSALIKAGGEPLAQYIAEHLLFLAKSRGITLVNISLLSTIEQGSEGTSIQISTLADTWIHVSYAVQAGERNRALTIIKSRGMKHSNQVRELILTDNGVELTDVYSAQGEVLFGTMRWQKEAEQRAEEALAQAENERRRHKIKIEQVEVQSQMERLKHELELKQADLDLLLQGEQRRNRQNLDSAATMKTLRSADREGGKGGAR